MPIQAAISSSSSRCSGNRAVHQPRAGERGAVALERVARRRLHPRVAGQAEVVVGAEHQPLAALHRHHRAGLGLDLAEIRDQVLAARVLDQLAPLVVASFVEYVGDGGGARPFALGCRACRSRSSRSPRGATSRASSSSRCGSIVTSRTGSLRSWRERRAFLDRERNPFFRHADVELFLAWRDGRPVGRISAHVDHHFNEFQQQRLGPVRVLRVRERPRGGRARCSTRPSEWLRDRGRDRMVGPMDFTTNDECGLLIEGHERKPLILEGWHHPYYLELLGGLGPGQGDGPLHVGAAARQGRGQGRLPPHDPRDGQEGHRRARRDGPEHAPEGPRGRDRPLPRGLQRGLGAQLGVRAAGRDRGPLVHEEPAADPGRELDLDRRARRRGAGRGADAARRQPVPGST